MGKSAIKRTAGMGNCDSDKVGLLMGPQSEHINCKWQD